MTFEFRPARRADTRLLVGLAGGTGAGKTESAMRLATGLAGDREFAVIDTENGRALHKADDYRFQHGELAAPFTPERYWEAIAAADAAGYPVIVVDSFSHEYEGVGGVLDMQVEEFDRLGGNEQARMRSWIEPKRRHKRLVSQLLQVRAHLIVCLRAEDKIEVVKENGKTVVRPVQTLTGADGWVPICERRFPFELTLSLLVLASRPGVPVPIKLEERHRPMVPLDRALDEDAGRKLAEWAAGGGKPPVFGQPERQALRERQKQHGLTDEQVRDVLEAETGRRSTQGVPAATLGRLLEALDRAAGADTADAGAQPEPEPEPEPGTEPEPEASGGDAQELFQIPAGARGGHEDHG